MLELGIEFIVLDTNFEWQCDFFKYVDCCELNGSVFFIHSSVDNLNAIPGFLDFFPGSSAYDFVRVRQCLLFLRRVSGFGFSLYDGQCWCGRLKAAAGGIYEIGRLVKTWCVQSRT